MEKFGLPLPVHPVVHLGDIDYGGMDITACGTANPYWMEVRGVHFTSPRLHHKYDNV